MLNKILIILVLVLSCSTGYFWYKSQKIQPLSNGAYGQQQKCLSWSTYDPNVKAWRWRAEAFNEYFPSKDEAVANCIVTLNVVKNQ